MEQILATTDIRQAFAIPVSLSEQDMTGGFFGAVYRAIHLAERIKAGVHILSVSDQSALTDPDEAAKKYLELLIETARADGITINYYITKGIFEDEVIWFVRENKITLLVLGIPDGVSESAKAFRKSLGKIRQNVNCTIELVRRKEL